MKAFVFNRNIDWHFNSYTQNVSIVGDSLIFKNRGVFFSTLLDSSELGTLWNNLSVISNVSENSKLVFRLFALDSDKISIDEGESSRYVYIEDFLKGKDNVALKLSIFNKSLEFENPHNVPLFKLKGRYLAFCIESVNYSNDPIEIKEVKINFPVISFINYLPEVYQSVDRDSFMSRFISIFQSMYLDVEEVIDNIPENFDPMFADEKFIFWICSLFGIEKSMWDESDIKNIILNMIKIFQGRGTRFSVIDAVKRYIKCDPIVVEKFRIIKNTYYKLEKELIDKLYGENNYYFTVILKEKDVIDTKTYTNLLKILSKTVPIDAICNLVLLTNNIILGHHCYLGLNSFISNVYVQESKNTAIKMGV